MAYHRCYKCGTSEISGAAFRYCYEYGGQRRGCGAEYCYSDSWKGQRCPNCGKGFLFAPDER